MSSATIGREIVNRILGLLREWGWDTAINKLKVQLDGAEGDDERAALQLFIGWMLGERGFHAEALKQMRALKHLPRLEAWGLVGQAFVMLRRNDFKRTHKLLDQALKHGPASDPILLASIAHCRGSAYYHQGQQKQALQELRAALAGFGRKHFCTGRVLDSIGMVYSSKNHFHAARELYSLALKYKGRHGDDAGCAVTEGQLGRLYMDWEQFGHAEDHFRLDVNRSRAMGDIRGEALLYNALARISMAKEEWDKAIHELEQSLQLCKGHDWSVVEGFARKDLALALLGQQKTREAAQQIRKARTLFEKEKFEDGLAHLNRVQGMLLRMQGEFSLSEKCLQDALRYFEQTEELGEAARTEFEIARTLRARNPRLAVSALITALDRAEKCRRDALVGEIEKELKEADELEYYRRIYQRVRGRNVKAGTESLFSGEAETLTVMFLDVQGSTEYARDLQPEDVMITMNQMTAEFSGILNRYDVSVCSYRGDGFQALVRERNHAQRAVMAALDMVEAMREFNAPRELIREYEDPRAAAEMKPLNIRIGMATGEVFLGNVGTYEKMDFAALGSTSNLAARLEAEGKPLVPCISQATYDRVKNDFLFLAKRPRLVRPKGFEDREMRAWDVVGVR